MEKSATLRSRDPPLTPNGRQSTYREFADVPLICPSRGSANSGNHLPLRTRGIGHIHRDLSEQLSECQETRYSGNLWDNSPPEVTLVLGPFFFFWSFSLSLSPFRTSQILRADRYRKAAQGL